MTIYGIKGHPTIINKLKNMAARTPPWVYIVKYDDIPARYEFKDICTEKSKVLRDYVIANPEILFLKLIDRLKGNDCELTNDEKTELRNYLISKDFLLMTDSIIESCYQYGDNDFFYDNIRNVFYSMINYILIESVFLYTYYEHISEIEVKYRLIVDHQDLMKDIEQNTDEYRKGEKGYWFPLSISLIKKLHRLDVHTANKIRQNFYQFISSIIEYQDAAKKKAAENSDLVAENKKKQNEYWNKLLKKGKK